MAKQAQIVAAKGQPFFNGLVASADGAEDDLKNSRKPDEVTYPGTWGNLGLTSVTIPPIGNPVLHYAPPLTAPSDTCPTAGTDISLTLSSDVQTGTCSVKAFDSSVLGANGAPLHTRQDIAKRLENSFQLDYAKLMVVEGCSDLQVDQLVDAKLIISKLPAPFPSPATFVPTADSGTLLRDDVKAAAQALVKPLLTGAAFAYLDLPGEFNLSSGRPLPFKLEEPTGKIVSVTVTQGTTVTIERSFTTLLECTHNGGKSCFFLVQWKATQELVLGATPKDAMGTVSGKVTRLTPLDPTADKNTIDTIRNTKTTFTFKDPVRLAP